jgi:hypothetical protein
MMARFLIVAIISFVLSGCVGSQMSTMKNLKPPSKNINVIACVFRTNPATIPAGKRPPFRRESGRHSDLIAATIPVQSGQCKMRV